MAEGGASEWQSRTTALLVKLARDPLVVFLLAGGLLFLAFSGRGAEPAGNVILIDPALREDLSQTYAAQMGGFPSASEMDALVARHVRDEMLYREALRLGFDEGDEIIRKRLIQKMEFLYEGDPAEIPEDELRTWYADHKDRFTSPARTSFRQSYFDPDTSGWDDAKARAAAALAKGDPASGDRSPLQREYADLGPQDAIQLFGESAFAKALASAPEGRWSGPYRSGYGWHLLYVTRRVGAETPPFADVAEAVRAAYGEERRSASLDQAMTDLAGRYRVREVR